MSKTYRPRRSVLYMPGANTRALEKARGLPADALIFDVQTFPLVTGQELAALFATDADVVVARSDDGGTSGLLRRPPGAIAARFGRRFPDIVTAGS